MLYDPKWEAPNLAGFIAWLESQNPRGRYQYMPANNCAIGQYLCACGTTYRDQMKSLGAAIVQWNVQITAPKPWTFGAAAKRARGIKHA